MFVGKREVPPTRPRRFGGLQRHAKPRRPYSVKFMWRRRDWKFLPLGNLLRVLGANNRGHGDVSLPQVGDWRMIVREGKVEIGNSGLTGSSRREKFEVFIFAVLPSDRSCFGFKRS